jgi:hypothetical protein
LKLLNALATLLVRRNEVAAVVVTKRGEGSGVVEVISCLHHDVSDGSSAELTIPQPASISSFFSNFLAIFNPRRDTVATESESSGSIHPVITDSKTCIPSDIRDTGDVERILTYIYDNW